MACAQDGATDFSDALGFDLTRLSGLSAGAEFQLDSVVCALGDSNPSDDRVWALEATAAQQIDCGRQTSTSCNLQSFGDYHGHCSSLPNVSISVEPMLRPRLPMHHQQQRQQRQSFVTHASYDMAQEHADDMRRFVVKSSSTCLLRPHIGHLLCQPFTHSQVNELQRAS